MNSLHIQVNKQLGSMALSVDLHLPATGITAIFGRSGSGKTSLINLISGLTTPDDGKIELPHRVLFHAQQKINVPVEKRKIGYVFQDARLFPHYRVRGNLLYGVTDNDPAYFHQVVQLLALQPLLERYPHALSGGEKQRVSIGRALLSKPDLLLMDEPLASLDIPRKREVMPFLEQLTLSVNIPVLYVTHSMNEVLRLADYLVVLDNGQELISGPVEPVWSSAVMRPWQAFSEQSTLLSGYIAQHQTEYGLSCIMLADDVGIWVQQVDGELNAAIRLKIRATDVSVTLQKPQKTSIRNILPAKVRAIEHLQQGENRKSVALQLALAENCFLWSTITEWALDDLQLSVGSSVYAQIKGVSVAQRDITLSHC
ncbi:molybdenum ABC transporter ATP-binding protein ModC [Vibrio sp. V27_P1S3P104]|nr:MULTISPECIES: molybdenum ABC transporter ATP-binding protein ModC [unclassified Vibrio]NAW69083.1 molybdenum ABC transporter ATP-binding protein ModC [Vibrio sp. V28_P6S34P95]NAX06324.1 molybdenum ABC transporter ATP-binding protein ModC [Vibrio sp. V30_P3S12P165]NAX38671.1 molybdenum ABC transporter ATP-binding protein ModC [Vibrio sp. V27_P1S3P104]NNN45027.1 molybdenum ABC transporter ATP-binding protein ModC [Vibrio sp. 1-1(7)]NNN72400.1 molybdenum ABC transporter ATP-binding protein Mod